MNIAATSDAIARSAFAEIARRFPQLKMVEDSDGPVEISISIPVQDGLKYRVWLALQNIDELHFSVEGFWVEWFPCTDPVRVRSYLDAVIGFLEGRYRVLERLRGSSCVSAELQGPAEDGWPAIKKGRHVKIPTSWKVTYREIRNTSSV